MKFYEECRMDGTGEGDGGGGTMANRRRNNYYLLLALSLSLSQARPFSLPPAESVSWPHCETGRRHGGREVTWEKVRNVAEEQMKATVRF